MKFVKYIAIVFLSLIFFSCPRDDGGNKYKSVEFDLNKIKERGKLVAITGYNAYSYFIYRGQAMGYEYDLVKRFADHLGVGLELKVVKEIPQMIEKLHNGEGDIIAFNLTVSQERKDEVAFGNYLNLTRQVLVQRRPENWRQLTRQQIDKKLIKSHLDLDGKTVYVRYGTSYRKRLENLSEENGITINIVEADPEISTEDLIKMVADGEIEYTVSDRNIAVLQQGYYADIDVSTEVSLPQKVAWAVRKNAPELLDTLNTWIDHLKQTPDYYAIYNKYYKNRNAFKRRVGSDYFSMTSGRISQYDDLIKKYADEIDIDWRVLSALIYKESQFNTDAQSWAGAKGLMQIMPSTASQFGVDDITDPVQNLDAGMRYLDWLNNYWYEFVEDSTERVKFVLASYNIGPGHIMDAYKLAEKYGANPQLWDGNVEEYLLKKSTPKYYNDTVVKNGYAKGEETVLYVQKIMEIYEHYKQFLI